MAMERCTSWVCRLQLTVPETLKWMRCRGHRCSGGTQSRSQNPAQSEIVATVVQSTGDIEAGGEEIGAPKKNKLPFPEIVTLLGVAVAATVCALGLVSSSLLSCEKSWYPSLLFSSVAAPAAALASWIGIEHRISNLKVMFFIGSLVLYFAWMIGVILFISKQMLCHG